MAGPHYPHRPVGSVEALARLLGVRSERELRRIAREADRYYRAGATQHREGKPPRKTRKAIEPLCAIQKRILDRLLKKVNFPGYLHGGVKSSPHGRARSTVTNAAIHLHAGRLIELDVANFFPTLTSKHVARIWQDVFCFPREVADCLTLLTTEAGFLPQGASTSTHLANLAFFDREPALVHALAQSGLRYSRFIDDIYVSSVDPIPERELTGICADVIGMMRAWDLRHSRRKFGVSTKAKAMQVNKLGVNSKRVTAPKNFRHALRAAVDRLGRASTDERMTPEYRSAYLTTSGRVAYIARLHPRESAKLRAALRASRPLPSDSEIGELRKRVFAVVRRAKDSPTLVTARELTSISSKVGLIGHARPRERARLLQVLRIARDSVG